MLAEQAMKTLLNETQRDRQAKIPYGDIEVVLSLDKQAFCLFFCFGVGCSAHFLSLRSYFFAVGTDVPLPIIVQQLAQVFFP